VLDRFEAAHKYHLSEYLADRLRGTPQIDILLDTEIAALHGDHVLRSITLHNRKTGREWTAETNWLFLCLGGVPQTQWAVEAGILRDEAGYLITGADLKIDGNWPQNWILEREPHPMETNVPGVFAAGDVRHGSIKRCTSAVGDGAMAIASVHRYLSNG
jgi:thioredoxin reductase (NADPH)